VSLCKCTSQTEAELTSPGVSDYILAMNADFSSRMGSSAMIRYITTLAILIVFTGCKKAEDAPKNDTPAPAVQPAPKKDNNGKPVQARVTARTKAPILLPFKEAVILGDSAPAGELPPPDTTGTGKNTVKLFESIANDLWDKVTFTDTNNDGKRIRYTAVIATELGDIHVDLHGDSAPNHVRSFVCLARAGYYDGMAFYYSIRRTVEDNTVAYVESGCPRGTGEYGSGSIGYWLRPEVNSRLKHDEGVVGACLHRDPQSAACRFYITAASMRQMDGSFTIFGKVTQGMDIVHTINTRGVQENDRLKQPVVIRSVTIRTVLE
jgi:peptidyl-prolyl cis-trans isomerase B (cyclophilin B)